MRVTVVLVTHNRLRFLRLVLRSLLLQTSLPKEVIVIDDASTTSIVDRIQDIISEYNKRGIQIRIIRTKEEIGLGAARGLGARLALGDYIVFLDDDVIASKKLIETYILTFRREKCDIVAGPCYPKYIGMRKTRLPSWWDESVLGGLVAVRNDIIYLQEKTRSPADYVFGCNFAISKRILQEVKGFKPWLGRVKGMLLSGEEWDLVKRALHKGFRVCFNMQAYVYHLILPSKITLERIWRMSTGLARTRCILSYEHTLPPVEQYMIRSFIALIKDFIEVIIYMIRFNKSKTMEKIFNLLVHLNTILLCKNTINIIKISYIE